MNPEQHARAKELFSRLQGLDRTEVERALLESCPDDPEVRDEILSLLQYDRPETIVLKTPEALPRASTAHAIATRFRRKEVRLKTWAVLGFLAIVTLGVITHRHVKSSTDQMIRGQVETLLQSTVHALHILFRNETSRLDSWVGHPELIEATAKVLEAARVEEDIKTNLLSSPAQAEIHALLDPLLEQEEYLGFALLSPSGRFLSGTRKIFDDLIGERVRGRVAQFQNRVINAPKGTSGALVARPIPPLPERVEAAEEVREILPLNFLSVWAKIARYKPAKDEEVVLGILVLLIRPEMDFSRLLMNAQIGETGETYAFDEEGYFLSESRFVAELPALGLLPEAKDGRKTTAIFGMKVLDPGRLLTTRAPLERDTRTLGRTKMLRLAVQERDGKIRSSLEGYRDYRGQKVVGAWTWLPEYGFGLATEIDEGEAFAPVYWVRLAFLVLFGLLLAALIFVLSSRFSVLRMQKKVDEARQIGPYRLVKKIGEGGIGEVYLAQHALLRRPTAIKLLKPRSVNPETLSRFEAEVQQTSRLTHPNTVEIYDYGHTPEGTFYYAMEYLPGLTMAALIQLEGPIEPRRCVHLLDQVCASLSEAHSKGLIHRDIKPQNIMLCERGGIYDTVKVLDFGLVKDIAAHTDVQLTAPDQLGGTPMYIAPERIKDPSRNDARTDLYAVGTVAFNLLTGRNPFDSGSSVEIVYQVMEASPPMVNDIQGIQVPDALNRLVARLLSKDPDDRPQSADELRQELAALDVGTWTFEDARRWWDQHQADLPTT